ncbi:hypothetical protein CK203_065029 [Vitis vinifera]|uniref:Reverse transcriptase/retrotransposon-derived protein RNase H-like domain-containing protein n=1 Tax=Vitis vinifera TaxID=29760 RepID=A0A438G580_VITVI|nr:hypothetical protein CK203_065029 [Vitis vinifera]
MFGDQANAVGQFKPNNNAPYGNTYNSSWRNHPNFSWKAGAPQYQQPAQPPQQSSSLEQAIVRDVKALITLRSGKKVEPPTPSHVLKKERREIKKREEMKGKKKDVSEMKEDKDSTVNTNPEKELLKEEMLKNQLLHLFLKLCMGKRDQKCIRNPGRLNVNKKAFLTEQVSAIIQCKSPLKYKDPGCPTIGGKVVEKALLDLGTSVNLLPYSVYKQLGLGELKPTSITLSLADRSVKIPRGEANSVPIILGRPFLATSNAIINCRNGLMQLTFGNMTLELNIFHMSKKQITPEEEEGPEEVCIIDTLVEEHCNQNMQDKLNESLGDLEEGLPEPFDVLATLQGWRRREEILPLFNKEEGEAVNRQEKCLLEVLKRCKKAIGWQISDLKGISPLVCTHHIYMEEEAKPICQPQRRLNPHLQEVVRTEVLKLLQAGIIYPISDSPWVSPTQVVPKKSGITVVRMRKGEEITNASLQVLERVSGHPFYCFLDGYSQGISKLKLMLKIRRRPLSHVRLEHTPIEECLLVYAMHLQHSKDEFLVNLEVVLNRCIEKDLVLNWEKCHFLVRQGIVLGHIISEKGIEVDKAKVELIVKLSSPTTVKGDAKFIWDERCQNSFDQLKQFLTTAPIVRAPNWQLPFEVMCDASDFAVGAVLGQREDGKPYVIYYASKTLNEAQRNYTTQRKNC